MSNVRCKLRDDGIAVVDINTGDQSRCLDTGFSKDLKDLVGRVASNTRIKGVIVTSSHDIFAEGLPPEENLGLASLETSELTRRALELSQILRALETMNIPVVALICGDALDGGFDLAMACHRRFAQTNAKLGFPGSALGLLPEAGGITRLTKSVGLKSALDLLQSGGVLDTEEAQSLGLVHAVASRRSDLLRMAIDWLLENQTNPKAAVQPWDARGFIPPGGSVTNPVIGGFVFSTAFEQFAKNKTLYPHLDVMFDSATEALKLDASSSFDAEARARVFVLKSKTTQNLVAANGIQLPNVLAGANRPMVSKSKPINRVGVIGAGMMGQGIAYACALAGIDVTIVDVSMEKATQALDHVSKTSERALKRGLLTATKAEAMSERVTPSANFEDLAGVELVIEAVFEQLELKHRVLEQNERFLTEESVWGTNTSTLPITRLAEPSVRPENVIGLHFFSPVDRMALVEIICGETTSDETLARAFDFVRQIGKTPIVVKDSVGFYTSRTISRQVAEGLQLVSEGVHPVRVDRLAVAFGMPVGPITLQDLVSQRLTLEAQETQERMGLRNDVEYRPPNADDLLKELVVANRGGRQFGGGFYDYGDDGKTVWPYLLEKYYDENNPIPDQDIKDRLLFTPVLESLRCIDEGVLSSAAEGNIGSLLGIGAPKWTGGYLQFVETYGLKRFVERCDDLAEAYGERFRPPVSVREQAKNSTPVIV